MSVAEPIATFTRDGKPAALKSSLLVLFFGPIAVFMGGRIAATIGTSVQVAQVAGTIVPTGLVVMVGYYFGSRGTVTIYEDRISTDHRSVSDEEVAVAVREEHVSDRVFGTATFRLFVPDATSVTLRSVEEPDEVGRLLANNLNRPSRQVANAPATRDDGSEGPEYIEDRWQFWDYWRADEPLPDTAVVRLEDLKRVMDVSALEVNRIDGVDMRDADGLSDVQTDDVTASSTPHHNP